ncbi:MAG: hypothetical protein DRN14_06450 [Thermoplasmata archaeon]|nr:MAG: hypothetical protein DRN14_06450 [Thermoplasmata archaeon]
MRVVTFKISEELLEMVDTLAQATGLSRSALIRRALILLLKGEVEDRLHVERKVFKA